MRKKTVKSVSARRKSADERFNTLRSMLDDLYKEIERLPRPEQFERLDQVVIPIASAIFCGQVLCTASHVYNSIGKSRRSTMDEDVARAGWKFFNEFLKRMQVKREADLIGDG